MPSKIDSILGFAATVEGLFGRLTLPDPAGFAEVWQAWPKRLDKGHARIAYVKALKKIDHAGIMLGVRAFVASRNGDDPKFTPHLATWLNGERWSDELPPPSAPSDDVIRQQAKLKAMAPAADSGVTPAERAEVGRQMAALVASLKAKVGP